MIGYRIMAVPLAAGQRLPRPQGVGMMLGLSDKFVGMCDTPILRVKLFGTPAVRWCTRPIEFSRRQVRALLLRLAIRPQPVARVQLCALFWPEVPDLQARTNLRRLLSLLRESLPDPDLLVCIDDAVGLDADRLWSDVAAFEQLCSVGGLQPQVRALKQAVWLRDAPLLSGFVEPRGSEFEAWAEIERQACEVLYLASIKRLACLCGHDGDLDDAVTYAQRYVSEDPTNAEMCRFLMQLHVVRGDRSAALRQFACCAQAYDEELGVAPPPASLALYHALRSGEDVLALPLPPSAPSSLYGDFPFVGRRTALRTLHDAFDRAKNGGGNVIAISGQPGIGKTRLLATFVTKVSACALVLQGVGCAGTRRLPYHPILDALRPVLDLPEVAARVQPVWLAEAGRLFPELGGEDFPRIFTSPEDDSRVRIFEALNHILFALATHQRPVVLCIDDLHWADSVTLEWLSYLSRHLRGRHILVVVACRMPIPKGSVEISRFLQDIGRWHVGRELHLDGLSVQLTLALLQHIFQVATDDSDLDLAESLRRLGGGNPYLMMEIMAAIIESGQNLRVLAASDIPLTDNLLAAVDVRLAELSPASRRLLNRCAALGERFSLQSIMPVSILTPEQVLDNLDDLLAHGLIDFDGEWYTFRHGLVQRVLVSALHPYRLLSVPRREGAPFAPEIGPLG